MFNWFKKNKNKNEANELKAKYRELDNGDIKLKIQDYDDYYGFCDMSIIVSKSSVLSCDDDVIVFKYRMTHRPYNIYWRSLYADFIDTKSDYVESEEDLQMTCEYDKSMERWKVVRKEVLATEEVYRRTPLEIFTKHYKSKYKLIETEDEFNDYLASTLDCNTWCRRKLYNKMKEVGLGDGFINEFADLIGNDLDKYHAMIDLAGEVSDKDTLMYLYTYKFGKR